MSSFPCLPERKNKRKCQISGLKDGHGRFWESFETVFDCEAKQLFRKWLLTGGGRYGKVDCML